MTDTLSVAVVGDSPLTVGYAERGFGFCGSIALPLLSEPATELGVLSGGSEFCMVDPILNNEENDSLLPSSGASFEPLVEGAAEGELIGVLRSTSSSSPSTPIALNEFSATPPDVVDIGRPEVFRVVAGGVELEGIDMFPVPTVVSITPAATDLLFLDTSDDESKE